MTTGYLQIGLYGGSSVAVSYDRQTETTCSAYLQRICDMLVWRVTRDEEPASLTLDSISGGHFGATQAA